MRIALVVDNPLRDLPGLVLLAVRLCQQGATCFLVPMYYGSWKGREYWALAPDFVLYNYLRTNNEGEVALLLDAGISIGVLDTEGGVLNNLDDYAQFLAREPAVRHRIACFCSWGRKLAEHAKHQDWFGPARVEVTGTPRYDFYAPSWRQAALRASPHADAYSRPMVLINGNFPGANPRFQTLEREAEVLVQYFGYTPAYARQWQDVNRRAMLGMAEMTNRLAERFPRVTFVYRPHPFEKLETYYDLLAKRDNLHLVKKGTVDGWILRASAVIQKSCSTAIEASVVGVPALSPAWLPTSAATYVPTAEEVSVRCETEDELADTLSAILAGRFERPAHIQARLDEAIADWFYRIDGRAHERVADCILQHMPADGRRERLHHCRHFAYGLNSHWPDWNARVRVALKDRLGLSVHWSRRGRVGVAQELATWPASEKYFSATQVQTIVDAIQACGLGGPGSPQRRVGVAAAQERGDYYFGYREGQSVTVFPT